MDALFARQGELQNIIDATDAWNLDSKLERAMDALRCPPEDQPVENLSRREHDFSLIGFLQTGDDLQ